MIETSENKAPKIQLDPERLLLLGGAFNLGSSNSKMIGVKWSPTCKEQST